MAYLLNLFAVLLYYLLLKAVIISPVKQIKYFSLIVTIHAILFRALADPYDYKDTINYTRAYIYISGLSFRDAALTINEFTKWGQGYVVLNWILSRISDDPNFLFVSLSVLTVGMVMWYYTRTSYSIFLTVILYLVYPMMYLMSFAVVRQHLSVAFMLMALYYIDDYKKSLPFAIMAGFSHYAGLVFLPYYVWRKYDAKELVSGKLFWLIGIGFIILRLSFGTFLSLLNESGVSRYDSFGEESDKSNLVPFVLIVSVIIMFWLGDIFKKAKGKDAEIVKIMTYGLLISLFSIGISGGGRLTLYFIYIIPVAITLLLKYAKSIRILTYAYLFLLFVLTIRQISAMAHGFVYNYDYNFFWDNI